MRGTFQTILDGISPSSVAKGSRKRGTSRHRACRQKEKKVARETVTWNRSANKSVHLISKRLSGYVPSAPDAGVVAGTIPANGDETIHGTETFKS